MGATKEQAELTRQRLLEAGLKIFSTKGFASTRLEDIAQEANVTRGAFYWHFKNKLELFCEVFVNAVEELYFETQSLLRAEVRPYDKLRRFVMHVPIKCLTDETFHAVGRLRYKIEWTADVAEAVHSSLSQQNRDMKHRKLLTQLIEAGQSSGEFRSDLASSAIVSLTNIFLSGLIHQVLEPGEPFSKSDVQETTENFLQSLAAK